ncbi:hypothetical protein Pan44_37480 [Caulifigura coniformis]|uniref:Uncharacterized protein n=1 Tax=Caulifigura coniformis TaxID=2527983 RepID=A0A517SHV0_9PLAN|nr:hypothetical protein [Caulifigura coniformis]QDT55702.1 hypothetical protein Pan44_37480 [Caulifigura coniformis]
MHGRSAILLASILWVTGCGQQGEAPLVAAPSNGPIAVNVDALSATVTPWWNVQAFNWDAPAVDWSTITPNERRQLSGLSGDAYVSTGGNSWRVVEYHRGSKGLKMRAQEERRGDKWTLHGPEVSYETDGSYEICFRKDGELHGPRVAFDASGKELWRHEYVDGIQQLAN